MTTTPAMARATEALHPYWAERYPSGAQANAMAQDAVSAALHDPDDDVIAGVLVEHTRVDPPSGRCSCGHVAPLGRRFSEHQADAVRAAILGTDS